MPTFKNVAKKRSAKASAPLAPRETLSSPPKTPEASASSGKAEKAFEKVVRALKGEDGVEEPKPSRREFGSNGLKVHGKIFAMLVRGALVVKLRKERVDELVASGKGNRFDPGRGRLMKEWLSIESAEGDWLRLAEEALSFVGGRKR
jgi:hypothetical protein